MAPSLNPIAKYGLFALGWVCVGLAIVGMFLPVMPTTVFLIVAIACFGRSSPRFERWILMHPTFGSLISEWRDNGAIPTKAKITAVCMICISLLIILWADALPLYGDIAVAIILALVILYLVTRPTPIPP